MKKLILKFFLNDPTKRLIAAARSTFFADTLPDNDRKR